MQLTNFFCLLSSKELKHIKKKNDARMLTAVPLTVANYGSDSAEKIVYQNTNGLRSKLFIVHQPMICSPKKYDVHIL